MIEDRVLFAQHLVKRCNLMPGTAFTYEQNLLRGERWLRKPAEEISAPDLERFLLESEYHPSTKNGTLVAYKRYHKFRALVLQRCDLNGIMAIEGPRQVRIPTRPLTLDQARTLLDAAKKSREVRIIRLGLYGGLRVAEAASIGRVHWIYDDDELKLGFVGKYRKYREIPVHPELERVRDLILSETTTDGTLKHVCRSLSHYTGIPFSSRSLRRTFSRRLRKAGVDRAIVGFLLGHGPRNVTETHYTPVEDDVEDGEAIRAMAKLSY